jgi:hypothetical protein
VSDEQNQQAPAEGNAAPSEPAKEPSFSAADVERILAADREQRQASEPDDPIAKFRGTVNGSKLYAKKPAAEKPQAQPQGSRIESLVESMLALQLASLKPPAPPAAPKPMTAREKLTSADETIWLRRGNGNEWSAADRAALVEEHRSALAKENFQGFIDREAEARASREIVAAGQRALRNVKFSAHGGLDLSTLLGRR